jgi:competence protein ComEA
VHCFLRRFALVPAAVFALTGLHAFAQDQKLPDGPGKDTFVRICGACHGPQIVIGRGNTEDGWSQVVMTMIQRGAQGTEDEFAQVVQYLTKNFPPGGAKVNVNKATADDLKSGLDLTDKEAQSVVAYRQQNGNFKAIDDLKKVPDLDFKKIEAKKDKLIF